MKKICLIPLDSRPVNYDWILELGNIANFNVITYPIEHAGTLLKGTDYEVIKNFILNHYKELDYLILSTDAFISGGLVQSREANFDLEEVKNRLSLLKFIKKENKNLKIYVFDTIMRTSISTKDKESVKYYNLINKYSYYLGKYKLYNDLKDLEMATSLIEDVPKKIVDTYLLCREKKLESNKFFLELQKEEITEYTVFLQEDSMPDGIQTIDQNDLKNYASSLGISNKIRIYNGTDEGAAILLGKICLDEYKKYPNVYFFANNCEILNRVMPFEDRPFIKNLYHMFEVLNFNIVNDYTLADFTVAIYSEEKYQGLHVEDSYDSKFHTDSAEYHKFMAKLNFLIDNNYTVCFIDLLFPNGGAYSIFKDIKSPLKLKGYSAWNTACNATGTALAQISIHFINEYYKLNNDSLNLKFLLERYIDDCFYQGEIRQNINEILEKEDLNIYNFEKENDYVQSILDDLLKKFTKNHFNIDFKCFFPWKRCFEINVIVDEKDLKKYEV